MSSDSLPFNPRAIFPHFYENPIISQVLAPQPIWTVSDPTSKMPIDARHLLAGCTSLCTHPDVVRGAWAHDNRVLVTLDELTTALPTAANCALWLDAPTLGCVVLDIEKTCPPEIRDNLLQAGALYAELSLSGRGYHLIMPLPKSFHTLPLAAAKSVLKEKHGWWEILQANHFATFTRTPTPNPVPSVNPDLWDEIWLSLAQIVNAELETIHDFEVKGRPTDPWYDDLLLLLTNATRAYTKGPANFDYDMSRFEWNYTQFIYTRLLQLRAQGHTLFLTEPAGATTTTDRLIIPENTVSWLLYETLVHHLEPRPKHNEMRNGLPLLLNMASRVVATRE